MEAVIIKIGYFFELWMLQLYAELLWNQKICFKGFSCVLFVINEIILSGINLGILPNFLVLFVHIILFLYLWLKFKKSLKDSIIKFCIIFILGWITEILAAIIVDYIGFYLTNKSWKLVLINAVSLSIAFLITHIIKKKRKSVNMKIEYKSLVKTILICIIPIGILILAYIDSHKMKIWYNVFVAAFSVIVLWYFVKVQRTKAEMEQKELELNINRLYGNLFENDINNIRKKQHSFKNQLAAIYSSHKTAKSLNELIELQKRYCDMIQEESEYEYILTVCNEPILAGFLYYKCVYCKSKKVKVDANIRVDKWSCDIMLYELIEILGIFIDNALEQELENDFSDKKIHITFIESEDKFYISVANRIKDRAKVKLTKIFEQGYSTKGEKRGLGLSRAKQICDMYRQEIKVMLEGDRETEIKFELEVLK